jgi:plastocyanin
MKDKTLVSSALESNGRFSYDKATMKLAYGPRDMKVTVADTISWLETKT